MGKRLFQLALERRNEGRPPVWFMRQAGRYHSHYQALRRQHSFIDLCKKPEIACETAMGPIRDFDFDAAILFSDLLFPLEAMGMGLSYVPGPRLDWHLREPADLARLQGGGELVSQLAFQGEAMRLTRAALPASKGLLGFVGGPLTLFCYAVDGSHHGSLESSLRGLTDGRYEGFFEKLFELLAQNMALQARGGADTIAVLDTCAGEFDAGLYGRVVVPTLRRLFARFHELRPGFPITYYSKGTGPDHWAALEGLPISAMGVDWRVDLPSALRDIGGRYAIQGNFDPEWMLKEAAALEPEIRRFFERMLALPQALRRGWICGLGHGVLQHTPEANVRLFLRIQKEMFGGGQ